MRKLSETFLVCLKSGFLSSLTKKVKTDPDLDLEIREDYVNVYYKGNSLLKLTENASSQYKAEIHKKFQDGLDLPIELNESTISPFVNNIPFIKENIIKYGKRSLEVEYEQMIIRANNFEPRNNTEYFIVDRQYTAKEGRFDLTGMYWESEGRRRGQEVPVCLMEIKFALNSDIKDVHNQLNRYYNALEPRAAEFAEEMETAFQQKIELGLYNQSQDRLDAMKTLSFSKDIKDFQFILILVDYNRNSTLLDLGEIANLHFAKQVKIFDSGFGMWHQNVKPLASFQ